MRESRYLELKETVTGTFLKTVSAFANYGTGEILFGIADSGEIKGIKDPFSACLDIENRINDSIDPVPEYTLSINERTAVITLRISEGIHKPYLYRSKAYRRNDTATVPADILELTRLILEGKNSSFEELPSETEDLRFTVLERKLKYIIHIRDFSLDTLRTLELYSDEEGFNRAAELLSDTNGFSGIDIARFGENISIILDRETIGSCSILTMYDRAVSLYRKYYQYEKITGMNRELFSLIPEEAFREAVANALVHRTWDVNAHVNVAMFPDRIEITSPGGLPKGMRKSDFLNGGISIPGNRIIASVFFRLRMIEKFGTGVRRIKEAYSESRIKPSFHVHENSIRITLPVIEKETGLSRDEDSIYRILKGRLLSSSEICRKTGFGKTKTVSILNRLVREGYVYVHGKGRGTMYSVSSVDYIAGGSDREN